MMNRQKVISAVTVTAAIVWISFSLLSCQSYEGDGQFLKKGDGWWGEQVASLLDIYTLSLGEIDLSAKNKREFHMRGLPTGESTVGLRVARKDKSVRDSILDSRPLTASIWIKMVNGDGEVVIDQGGPLNEWVWSGLINERHASYLYRRGKSEDVRLNETTTRVKEVGVLADSGWGTYFTPRWREAYHLTVEILETDQNAKNFEVELLIDRVRGAL